MSTDEPVWLSPSEGQCHFLRLLEAYQKTVLHPSGLLAKIKQAESVLDTRQMSHE